MTLSLVPVWTVLLALAVFYYVVFDGFDLGVGILYGFARDDAARRTMMASIAPVWDGNETWLVFGGIGLLAAFPLAFAIIIPAVYFPILVMLLALVFRGVAFEFRVRDFDGDELAVSKVRGAVDAGHAGAHDECFDAEVLEALARLKLLRQHFPHLSYEEQPSGTQRQNSFLRLREA